MTITFIASTAASAINGVAITHTFSAGSNAGDVAICLNTTPRTATVGTVTSSAGTSYTKIGTTIENGNLSTTVWYRVLNASETTATSSSTANSQDGHTSAIIVFRGVASPLQFDFSNATGTSASPNSPAAAVGEANGDALISGMAILIAGAGNTAPTTPGSFINLAQAAASDTRSTGTALSWLQSSQAGEIDPGAYTSTASAAWAAWTISLRSTNSSPFPLAGIGTQEHPSGTYGPIDVVSY